MKQVDILLVGMGLSGSILAYELTQAGFSVCCFDEQKEHTSSKIAIGLVNPITGKRLVKSWLIDELLPKAISFYKSIEQSSGQQLIHACKIARIIPNEDIFQQWGKNFNQAVDEGYIDPTIYEFRQGRESMNYFLIKQSFWLNTKQLIQYITKYFLDLGKMQIQTFDRVQLKVTSSTIRYKEIEAKKLIFCEGYQAIHNPYFSWLPFNVNKGEVIDVSISNYQFTDVLKKNIFIVPTNSAYRVGATYDRENIDEQTTLGARTYFEDKLHDIFGDNHTINFSNQKAAIRPATTDRRPFIGKHPQHESVYIFNGFGAKGVSLIPYFASQFTQHLLDEQIEINPEASISRFVPN